MPAPSARSLLRALVLACAALSCAETPALAAPGIGGISARPIAADGTPRHGAYFDLRRSAGDTYVGHVEISNATGKPIPVHVAAVDATTSVGGGAAFLSRTAPASGVGAWISPRTMPLTLGAGSATRMRFEVRIPPNATPGDHVGGLVVEPDRKLHVGSAADITRVVRVVLAVRVRVAGEAEPALDLGAPRLTTAGAETPPTLTVKLANEGALLCRPTLSATLSADGAVVSSERRSVDTVLAHTSADVPIRWSSPVADGTYDAEVRAEGCGAPSVVRSVVRLGEPAETAAARRPTVNDASTAPIAVQLAGLLAGVLAAGSLGWWIARRRRRRSP